MDGCVQSLHHRLTVRSGRSTNKAHSTTVSKVAVCPKPSEANHSTTVSKLQAEITNNAHPTTVSKMAVCPKPFHGDVHAEPSEANHSTTVSNLAENTS